MNKEQPVVLIIAGLDPSGGAGIQADIQTLSALQCHCTSIVSTLTVQDSSRLYHSHPVAPDLIDRQLQVLDADLRFSAIKLGALGSADNALVVAQFIQKLTSNKQSIPIILDPVIKASSGGELSDKSLCSILLNKIIPHCTLITPNQPELCALADDSNTQRASTKLAELGASIVITGGHNRDVENNIIENRLISGKDREVADKNWKIMRLSGEFRGTGCTFSSAIAGYMAQGLAVDQAIEKAQFFVSNTLESAYTLTSGQQIPQRATVSL